MRWTLLTLALALLLCSAAVAQQLPPVYPQPPTSQNATPTFLVNPTTGASIPGWDPTGITPVVSASAEAAHVLKNSPGNLYGVYAVNQTATNGFLAILNLTAAPADGAITPLACVPLAANSVASVSYGPGPPAVYSTGITAVITSATTCFTKTTGVITGYIGGAVK